MKTDYSSLAILGLKVLLAVGSAVVITLGVKYLLKSEDDVQPSEPRLKRGQSTEKEEVVIEIEDEDKLQPGDTVVESKSSINIDKKGQRILKGLQYGQTILMSVASVVGTVVLVSSQINRLFDKKTYTDSMINDPNLMGGPYGCQIVPTMRARYPWEQPYNPGMPYNTPIYQGTDRNGDKVWWCRTDSNIIEVH